MSNGRDRELVKANLADSRKEFLATKNAPGVCGSHSSMVNFIIADSRVNEATSDDVHEIKKTIHKAVNGRAKLKAFGVSLEGSGTFMSRVLFIGCVVYIIAFLHGFRVEKFFQ